MRVHDLTLACRTLVQRPLFAATAILLMALAAAANAAVFSIVRGVLLKPLPYGQPHELVSVWPDTFVSNEDLLYWRERTHSFSQIAGQSPGWLLAMVADGYEPVKVTGGRMSDNFFQMLGVGPAIGRTLEPGDSQPGRTGVVVISTDLFERHFGSDPRTVGGTVRIDNRPHQIVGVMPRAFEFLEPGTDVWLPLLIDPADRGHKANMAQAFARLKPGVTAESASRELVSLVPTMRQELGKLREWGQTVRVEPLHRTVTGTLEASLVIMLGSVGLILLLAAVNLGTLVLSRSIERTKEIALRTALGASRWRLMRQLLVEQAVLAAAGAVVGLAAARLALPLLVARIPPDTPRQGEIALDAVVFAVVLSATMAVALIFALAPVAIMSRPELQPLLRQAQSTDTSGRRRALGSLVAAQIALAIVLGIGAGLMLRSLWRLQQVDPGFDSAGVLTFRLQSTSKYSSLAQGMPYLAQVIDRVRALPGVTSVGAIQHLPMTGYNWSADVYPVETPPPAGAAPPKATWRFIDGEYFQTLRIPLRAGRLFTPLDTATAPRVVIVNETFARQLYGSAQAAVGRRLSSYSAGGSQVLEIVGVSGDVRFLALDTPARAEMYRPLAQTFMFPMAFVVRTTGDPAQLAGSVRQAAYAVDPTVPVAEMQTLGALLAQSLGRPRLLALLLSVFAAVGLTLTIIGVYGVVAYWVQRREREFGIRLALGAAPTRIARTVVGQGARCAALGIVVALPAAFAMTRLMGSVVYGVSVHDPVTFVALPVVVLCVTLAAAYFPARQAARVDPATTMRAE